MRHAARAVLARPALSTVIVSTMAVALAANATIFSLADGLFLRPFRFPGVDRLVLVTSTGAEDLFANRTSVAPADFVDWTQQASTVRDLAAARWWDPNLSGIDRPEQVPGFRVTPAFLRVLGQAPLHGRLLVDADGEPGRRVAVLGHALWTRRFGADPAIVGRTIRLDSEPYEVVGVMPRGVAVPYGAEVWAPLALTPEVWRERARGSLLVIARLAEGRSLGEAAAEFGALVERQRAAWPATNARREVTVLSFTRGLADESAGPFVLLWQAAALLLGLVACANVANLLLARTTERAPEFAVRLALGAGRGRLALQVVVEGVGLALVAAVVALPLAAAGIDVVRAGLPPAVHRFVPGLEFMHLGPALGGGVAVTAVAAALLFSWLPALQAARASVGDALHSGPRTVAGAGGRAWIRSALAVTQIAVTVALVVGSVLILAVVDDAVRGPLGFDAHEVLTATLTVPARRYPTADDRRQFVERVRERLVGRPAVRTVGVVSHLPYAEVGARRAFIPEGATPTPAEIMQQEFRQVSPEYFEVLRIRQVDGRGIEARDVAGAPAVAVVSQSLAAQVWPDGDIVGRRFRHAVDGGWITVVGVVADVRHDWLFNRRRGAVYRPLAQDPPASLSFVVRTQGDPLDIAGDLRRAVAAADPDQPLQSLRSMEQVVADRAGGITSLARALAAMALVAVVLAVTGIYSLVAFTTARRTREIGVRMALGATPAQVVRLAARQAAGLTLGGLVVGVALAIALSRVMQAALFGLVAPGVGAIAAVAALVAAATLLAGYLPARRAAGADPAMSLRAD